MQPLLVFAVMLQLFMVSEAQSGGDQVKDDVEDDAPSRGCVVQKENSATVELNWETNLTAAVLRARCYSVCLEQVELGSDKLTQTQVPHVTMSELTSNCGLYNKVEACVRGCVFRETASSYVECNETCASECPATVNKPYCNFHCDENHCFNGCIAFQTTNDTSQAPLRPFTPPTLHLLMSTSTNATYSVNISMIELYSIHNTTSDASGLAPLDTSPVVFIFNITSLNTGQVYFLVQPGLPEVITFHTFICEEVKVQFALTNRHGLSGFSPCFTLYIQGDEVSPPEPVDLATISMRWVYDYRHGFFGHARLNITWENPPNITQISHFMFEMSGLQNCGSANYSWIKPSSGVTTTHLVTSETPEAPPILGCFYAMKLQSVSLSEDYPPANTTWNRLVPLTLYKPSNIILQCYRSLENNLFSITVKITVSQYLANERVFTKFFVTPSLVEYEDSSKKKIARDNFYLLREVPVESNQSVITTTIPGFQPKSEPIYDYVISVQSVWKKRLFISSVMTAICHVDALAFRPGPPTDVQLFDQIKRMGTIYYVIPLQWSPPTETNGELVDYDVCMGTTLLGPTDPLPNRHCSSSSDCFTCTKANPDAFNMTWEVYFSVPPGTDNVYVQVRSRNTYLPGNWSNELTISLTTTMLSSISASRTISVLPTISPRVISASAITSATPVNLHSSNQATTMLSSITASRTSSTITPSVISASATVMKFSSVSASRPASSLPTMHPSLVSASVSTTPVKLLTRNQDVTVIVAAGVSGALFVPLAAMVTLFILCIHWKIRQRKRQLEFIREINDDPIFRMGPRKINPLFDEPGLTTDDWEIPAAQVIIDESLGEGAFGEVYKGVITEPINNPRVYTLLKQNYSSFVAVKLLKASASGNERTDFLSEIELMKRIAKGNNSHVVNMVGCVTIQEPLCLITEFVKYGDLQSYLRTNRKLASERREKGSTSESPYSDLGELKSVDLISFAYQIASGMEFLASLGIIHRDLASRNILVGEGKSLKISDFGMARDVGTGSDDVYVKTTRGRLPLKWMAIESIVDREFTTASDVWAYGVTLWEIGTLGGFPYPTVANEQLLLKLKQGYRMEKPENCSPEIYDIMLECWHETPRKRPSFTQLRAKFDSLLATQQGNPYIDLQTDECKDYYNFDLLEEETGEELMKDEEEEVENSDIKKEDEEEGEENEEDEKEVNESTSLHTPERISKSPDTSHLRQRKSPSPSFLSCRSPRSSYLKATPSPSRLKKSPSPSRSMASVHSLDTERLRLQVTNPWISDEDIGYTTLTPANPFHHSPHLPSRPRRPTSITVWEGHENEYVEEPSLPNVTLIQVVPSTPTPQSDATDRLLRLPSPV